MTFDETIKYLLICYPSLFINKAQCLEHLFLVIGNGYSWVDGQLKENFPRKKIEQESMNRVELKFKLNDVSFDSGKLFPVFRDSCYLYNYPEDIKPDWLEAIEYTKELFKEYLMIQELKK